MAGWMNGNGKLWQMLVGVSVGAVLALGGWTLAISQRVTAVETNSNAHAGRLEALESGRTTPMSAEARAEFVNVRRDLAELQESIRTLSNGQSAIMSRLLDMGGERKR
jgi:hypothetical protein